MSLLVLVITLGTLAVAAVLRAAGTSMARTPRADALHDAADGAPGATAVAGLLEDRARNGPSISLVHAVLLVASCLSGAWVISWWTTGWQFTILLVASGFLMVLWGEWLPRSLGMVRPRRLAYRFARLLRLAVWVGQRAAFPMRDQEEGNHHAEDPNGDHDVADREEIRMISSVLDFSDAIVREVMVPRTDMVTLNSELTTDEALDVILENGFSRVPLTGRGVDDIVGLVYAKDLLRLVGSPPQSAPVAEISRPPYFVPETKPVRDLLKDMQSSQFHMAIAVDEFGGIAGLVTIEDLLEELVGEIVDEYDTEPSMVQRLDEGGFLVDARLPVDELSELLDTPMPEGEWDTVGGLVLGLAGRVPVVGERFQLDGAVLIPERVQGRRVEQVRADLSVTRHQ